MEQEIQKLQARLDKAKEVFREMNAKDKEKDARIAELEAQLAEAVAIANNNSTVGNDAIAELKAQLRTMEDRYKQADTYCEKIKEDNEKLSNLNEMLRNQVEGAKNDINELIVEKTNLNTQIKEFEIANEDLRLENMKNKGERDRIELDYNALNESFKTVTEENALLKEKMIEFNERFTMYEETNTEYKQSIDKLIETKHKLETEIESLKSGENVLRVEISNLNGTITEAEKTISAQDKQILSLQTQNTQLTNSLNKAEKDNSQIKETVTKHVATIKKSMQGLNDGLGSDFNIFD